MHQCQIVTVLSLVRGTEPKEHQWLSIGFEWKIHTRTRFLHNFTSCLLKTSVRKLRKQWVLLLVLCHTICLAVCIRDGIMKAGTCGEKYGPTSFSSLFLKSKPIWLCPKELRLKQKRYFFRMNVDRLSEYSLHMKPCMYCLRLFKPLFKCSQVAAGAFCVSDYPSHQAMHPCPCSRHPSSWWVTGGRNILLIISPCS